jgi:hypothetical protein
MALSQADRISISGKIVAIPAANAAATQSQATLGSSITTAQSTDTANMNLVVGQTAVINPYQAEVENLDGNTRTVLVEQNYQDAVNRVIGNYFFLNQPSIPTPSAPAGVWKFYPADYAGYGQGKNYLETYASQPGESPLITDALNQISIIAAQTNITRVTGESCSADVISNDPTTQAAMTALISDVNSIVTAATAEQTAIGTNIDTNPTNTANTATALANITPLLTALNAWLAVPTFNLYTGAMLCTTFNSTSISTLIPTKGDPTNLPLLQTALTTRQSQVTTRISQIATILGTVTQSATDGSFMTATGLYGSRAMGIDIRINAIGGSLSQLKGLQNGSNALTQSKASNNNATNVYASVMTCTAFAAPANGTAYVNVNSSTGLIAGNMIYVVSDTQPEITAYIKSINANQLLLDRAIPATYTQSDNGRLYLTL